MKEIQKHYNSLAIKYSEIHPFRPLVSRYVLGRLKKNKSDTGLGFVVDFGCGSGDLLEDLKGKVSFPDRLLGIDASKEMVAICKAKGLDVRHASFDNFSFNPGSVSLAIFQESVHHARLDTLGLRLKAALDQNGELLVFYQTDWALEPRHKSTDYFVSYARSRRKGYESILSDFLDQGMELVHSEDLVSKNNFSLDLLKEAIQENALSYWKDIPELKKKELMDDLGQLGHHSEMSLLRKLKVLCFRFKSE